MIAWWGWLLIWVGLVLVLLGVLALCAWRLFRKGVGLLDDLGELGDRMAILEVDDAPHVRPVPAVLLELSAVRSRHETRMQRRRDRRDARRASRLARAKRITTLDATTVDWPAAWSEPRAQRGARS